MLLPFGDNLNRMLLMLRLTLLPKKLSITRKPKEEMVNSPISNGLLTSSKSKLLPLVTPSEVESMITYMMRDLTACSTGELMKTLRPELKVPLTEQPDHRSCDFMI